MELKIEVEDTKGLTRKEGETGKIKNAEKILCQMKKNIVKRFPSMYTAVCSMQFVPVREFINFETDGSSIFYSPDMTIKDFKSKKMGKLEYRYMHIMAHGLLEHYSMAEEYQYNPLMHAVMDYKVYTFLKALGVSNPEPGNMEPVMLYGNRLSLKKIYREVCANMQVKRNMLDIQKVIGQDDYKIWTRGRKYHMYFNVREQEAPADKWTRLRKGILLKNKDGSCDIARDDYGNDSLSEEDVVKAKEFARVEYKNVLRQFFKMRESTRENVETIDKALYSWGFEQYGDVAFIEPEAESINSEIETIVLAIDTSGSCDGGIIEQFMAETRKLFQTVSKTHFREFAVIQCDSRIQKVDTYKKTADFPKTKEFNKGQRVFGFGGTDFKPVFDYVDELQKGRHRVDCLIYLTDGMGNYPEEAPKDYKVFFVLPYSSYDASACMAASMIPDWIEKIYLNCREEDE